MHAEGAQVVPRFDGNNVRLAEALKKQAVQAEQRDVVVADDARRERKLQQQRLELELNGQLANVFVSELSKIGRHSIHSVGQCFPRGSATPRPSI